MLLSVIRTMTSRRRSSAATGTPVSPPVNTALPVITGTTIAGEYLSCDNGTWTNTPTSYTYQWNRDGVAIESATSNTYLLDQSYDSGAEITCTVIASNTGGASDPATSEATVPITAYQRTTFTASANTSGGLDGKYLLISDAEDTYGVILRSKRQQVSTIDFGPLVGESLITGSAGKSFQISIGATLSTVWFNTGTETAPGGPNPVEVSVSNVYDTNGIASATASVIGSGASAAITLITYTNPTAGNVEDGGDVDSGVLVTVTTDGYDGDTTETAAGSTFPLPVYIVHEDTASTVAAAIETALEGVGFVVTQLGGGQFVARDAATGLRASADAGTTGFTMNVTNGA